ncbi:hypothetical protein SISNIDRAFT_543451 [Sistotremastrum niveocremeum HHB9708]|uniref:DUF6535 domain-containing protein n=1 Tax=Sistotremastrum niveocremeum HHB9708 TaxID=1314777 RepID=A0A164WNW4_9AGAM|nr:hypothetical protein SISNIDRAFT_543451 [Sistotremastrum niveocremeum HHB9708]
MTIDMAPVDDSHATTSSNAQPNAFKSDEFQELLAILKKQTEYLEVLQKEAVKGNTSHYILWLSDQSAGEEPYAEGKWYDEPAWNAMFTSTMEKTKEKAEEWRAAINISLVFIALFLTVITAFLVPAIQSLSATPTSNTLILNNPVNCTIYAQSSTDLSPAQPASATRSAQIVCLFFYGALIISILTAVLCVQAQQWLGKLISIPEGATFLERTMRHEERRKLGQKWLAPLVDSLRISLMLSIAMFIAGLLYQLWSLSFSVEKASDASILLFTSSAATLLCVLTGVFLLYTKGSAAFSSNILFESFLSRTIMSVKKRLRFPAPENEFVTDSDGRRHPFEKMRSRCRMTFAKLVQKTTEAGFLDLVAPSLLNMEWSYGETDVFAPLLHASGRLLSTDTSLRTRVTIAKGLTSMMSHLLYRIHDWDTYGPKLQEPAREVFNRLRYLYLDARDLATRHRETFFIAMVNMLSLMRYPERFNASSFEWAVIEALKLSSITPSWKRGDDYDFVFRSAIRECRLLFDQGKKELLKFILSKSDHVALIKALISDHFLNWEDPDDLGYFFLEGHTTEIWNVMMEELKFQSDDERPGYHRFPERHFSDILWFLTRMRHHLDFDVKTPSHIDISTIFQYYCRKMASGTTRADTTSTLMFILEHSDWTSQISEPDWIKEFIWSCRRESFASAETREKSETVSSSLSLCKKPLSPSNHFNCPLLYPLVLERNESLNLKPVNDRGLHPDLSLTWELRGLNDVDGTGSSRFDPPQHPLAYKAAYASRPTMPTGHESGQALTGFARTVASEKAATTTAMRKKWVLAKNMMERSWTTE